MKKPIYKRIVLKLSGEALEGDRGFGVDPKTIASIAQQIKDIRQLGVDIVCIIGGGNFFAVWKAKKTVSIAPRRITLACLRPS